MAEWCEAKVIEIKTWTPALFSLVVQASIRPFTAGQFAKLSMNIGGQRIQRAYSYVNPPQEEKLEFYLVDVPQGALSPALHRLNIAETIEITADAAGFFVLNEVPDCQILWMLATGTAIGPYLSILQNKVGLERFEKIILVHAARYADDLSYWPLMQQLVAYFAGKLVIQAVVSREQRLDALQGRIPELIANGALEQSVGQVLSPETSHVMLCGNPQMVRETQQLLIDSRAMQRHLRRKPGHITSEQYW